MTTPSRPRQPTLRQLRQAHGWTQEVLAGRLRVGRSTIAWWESGARLPRAADRQRLADLFGVPVEAIAFGPVDKQS